MTNEPISAEGYLAAPETPSNERVIPIRVGGGLHGVPVGQAGDMVVLTPNSTIPVAFAPARVRGVLNQHGRMATVIETRLALGVEPAVPPSLVGLTVEQDGHLYVLAVDEVREMADPAEVREPIAPLDLGAIVSSS